MKTFGPNGEVLERCREYYYECDLGRGGRRHRQTRLSFVRTTARDNLQDNTDLEDNTNQGEVGL